jgi:peptidyl-lysine (3S)-dioxygenase / protease
MDEIEAKAKELIRREFACELNASLWEDAQYFWSTPEINVIHYEATSPLTFYREYVAMNRPVLIDGAIDDWKALHMWKDEAYLRCMVGNAKVSVNFSPDGLADAVKTQTVTGTGESEEEAEELFVKPLKQAMTMASFLDALQHDPSAKEGVPYLSEQNDSLRTEFKALLDDVTPLQLANEAFGGAPEAMNIWMGDSRSISSCHADFYENIYCVITGSKTFTLLPPTDVAFLHERDYHPATYFEAGRSHTGARLFGIMRDCDKGKNKNKDQGEDPDPDPAYDGEEGEGREGGDEGAFEVDVDEDMKVPWIALDPARPTDVDPALYPSFAQASPLTVTVQEGQCLYLPCGWFHRVSQTGTGTEGEGEGSATIAVNFWYDMQFGPAQVAAAAARKLAELAKPSPAL